MQGPNTQVPHSNYPGSKQAGVTKKVPSDLRDKKPLIPASLDITRTEEFWKNAVWS